MSTHGSEDKDSHHGLPLQRQLTTVTLSPEQFEALYLQPRGRTNSGNLASKVGNPTPWGLTVFILALMPLAMELLNFQGTTTASAVPGIGQFYGMAGIALYICAILEWTLGNTFSMVVLGTFGGFWISYAILLTPSFGIAATFAPPELQSNPAAAAAAGALTREYNSAIAVYLVVWSLVGLLYFVCAFRTNVPFVALFFCLVCLLDFLAAGYFHLGQGKVDRASKEIKAAGVFAFLISLIAWWINIHVMLASVDFPVNLPMFDLSEKFQGKEQKRLRQEAMAKEGK